MANNKKNIPAGQDSDMEDLFRLLDSMEERSLGDDIEDAIRQYGYGDTPSAAYVPPEKGFNPNVESADLSALLIGPDDADEEDGGDTLQQAAQLLSSDTEEDMTEDLPPPPEHRRNPLAVIGHFFGDNLPAKGDDTPTLVRKCGFWLSLTVMLAALVYLFFRIVILPAQNSKLNSDLVNLYHWYLLPENPTLTDDPNYPNGMLSAFKGLYQRNKEVSGWLSFHAAGKNDFINVEYPVMYSGDNTKYARVDFDQKKNKNGCLFLDSRNLITGYDDMDRSMIIYGHNMASGQMFAGLNKLVGNEGHARLATTFTFSTLFRQDEYKVFAVCLSDEAQAKTSVYFNYWRTEFETNEEFLSFVQQVRDRSLFDYPTDVRDDDSILILGSCTGRTSANLNDGRVLVFARRVRPDESAKVDSSKIVKNIDVIMPYSWYVNQSMTPHEHYGPTPLPTLTTTTTTTTTTGTGSTDDTTTTTETPDTTVPTTTTTTPANGGDEVPLPEDNDTEPPSEGDTPTEGGEEPTEPTETTTTTDDTEVQGPTYNEW